MQNRIYVKYMHNRIYVKQRGKGRSLAEFLPRAPAQRDLPTFLTAGTE